MAFFENNMYNTRTTYWGTIAEVTYTSGTPGQNNAKPAAVFYNHQIVYVPTMRSWYDPSYGVKHVSEQDIDNTLSGFILEGQMFSIFRKTLLEYKSKSTRMQ